MHVFKHEGYSVAWEKIILWRAALKGKAKRETADRLLNFVSLRKEMIHYPIFRKRGWQIGSGPTESQGKLCTKRLKGYGRRWDRPHATAVAAWAFSSWKPGFSNQCRSGTAEKCRKLCVNLS